MSSVGADVAGLIFGALGVWPVISQAWGLYTDPRPNERRLRMQFLTDEQIFKSSLRRIISNEDLQQLFTELPPSRSRLEQSLQIGLADADRDSFITVLLEYVIMINATLEELRLGLKFKSESQQTHSRPTNDDFLENLSRSVTDKYTSFKNSLRLESLRGLLKGLTRDVESFQRLIESTRDSSSDYRRYVIGRDNLPEQPDPPRLTNLPELTNGSHPPNSLNEADPPDPPAITASRPRDEFSRNRLFHDSVFQLIDWHMSNCKACPSHELYVYLSSKFSSSKPSSTSPRPMKLLVYSSKNPSYEFSTQPCTILEPYPRLEFSVGHLENGHISSQTLVNGFLDHREVMDGTEITNRNASSSGESSRGRSSTSAQEQSIGEIEEVAVHDQDVTTDSFCTQIGEICQFQIPAPASNTNSINRDTGLIIEHMDSRRSSFRRLLISEVEASQSLLTKERLELALSVANKLFEFSGTEWERVMDLGSNSDISYNQVNDLDSQTYEWEMYLRRTYSMNDESQDQQTVTDNLMAQIQNPSFWKLLLVFLEIFLRSSVDQMSSRGVSISLNEESSFYERVSSIVRHSSGRIIDKFGLYCYHAIFLCWHYSTLHCSEGELLQHKLQIVCFINMQIEAPQAFHIDDSSV